MSKKSSKSSSSSEKCPHCKTGSEVFRYLKRQYVFDVDHARLLVADGREAVEVDPQSLKVSVEETHIHSPHLAHVDTKYPGIIAYVFAYQPDGEEVEGHLLIDGNHRAARCLELGIPYYVYILTREESRKILLKAPKPKLKRRIAAETPV